jgi:hypothetical protein
LNATITANIASQSQENKCLVLSDLLLLAKTANDCKTIALVDRVGDLSQARLEVLERESLGIDCVAVEFLA